MVVSDDDPDMVPAPTSATTAAADMRRRRNQLYMRISATQQSRKALGTYLETIKADRTDFSSLRTILEKHDKLAGELDTRILDLEKEMADIDDLMIIEKRNSQNSNDKHLTRKISITVQAQKARKVTFIIKYRRYL